MNFFLNLFSGAFIIIVQFFLWTAIYDHSNRESVYGYTYEEMIVYIITAGIISKLISTGNMTSISADIKSGALSKFLVQPISYISYRASLFLGQTLCDIGFMLIIWVLSFSILGYHLNVDLNYSNLLLVSLPMMLSIILNFFISYCISMLSFWITEVFTLFWGINITTLILSGSIFPLDIFGDGWYQFFCFLPFQYTSYFPLRIIVGKLNGVDILVGMMAQVIWIVVLAFLAKRLWKSGIKKYIAVGG